MLNLANTTEIEFLISIVYTLSLSLVMMLAYRLCHDTLTYNSKFNITLVMMSFISTILLMLVQSNPLMSLGVLGSLSICRIRMNTKDPRDLGFVFWALSIGIASATKTYIPGIACACILFVILMTSNKLTLRHNSTVLVVRGKREILDKAQNVFKNIRGISIQSENIFENTFELVYQINLKKEVENQILSRLNSMDGITGVNVLAPETEAA